MRLRSLSKIVCAGLLLAVTTGAIAKTGYVSDELRITVRKGQSTSHGVITTIASGAEVEILNIDGASGYSQVKLSNGSTGWVLSRFLLDEPIARTQLAGLKKRLSQANQELVELKPLTASQQQQITELGNQRDQLDTALKKLRAETADTVAISKKNRLLIAELASASSTNSALTDEVNLLTDDHRLRWFLYGSGVIVLGILFGLLLPKLRIQRKAWDEF